MSKYYVCIFSMTYCWHTLKAKAWMFDCSLWGIHIMRNPRELQKEWVVRYTKNWNVSASGHLTKTCGDLSSQWMRKFVATLPTFNIISSCFLCSAANSHVLISYVSWLAYLGHFTREISSPTYCLPWQARFPAFLQSSFFPTCLSSSNHSVLLGQQLI